MSRTTPEIPKELPLVNEFIKFKGEIDLSNTVLFAVQHLLGSNVPLFLALNKLGLDFSNMFVIGKVYSSNPEVVKTLKKLGIYVHPDSLRLDKIDLTKDYHKVFSSPVKEVLEKATSALAKLPQPRRLLVLDDGGVGIVVVNNNFKRVDAEVVAVEQTRSGTEIIRTLNNPSFPIINVAESDAKLVYESPYIATSVLKEMKKKLAALPTKFGLDKAEVLVVGYGALGTEVAKQLYGKGIKTTIYDSNGGKMKAALEAGLVPTELSKRLSESNLIIGAVGKSWLPKDFTEIARNGTFLVSASSSNVEFLGLQVEDKGLESGFDKIHSDYKVKTRNGDVWILNAGFPVNFDGSIDPIPPNVVQLTRALMLAGIYQAVGSNQEGLIPLDNSSQQLLVNKYRQLLRF